jgi:hypothetical protein
VVVGAKVWYQLGAPVGKNIISGISFMSLEKPLLDPNVEAMLEKGES